MNSQLAPAATDNFVEVFAKNLLLTGNVAAIEHFRHDLLRQSAFKGFLYGYAHSTFQ